jgi:putative phosphoribosyl transferase
MAIRHSAHPTSVSKPILERAVRIPPLDLAGDVRLPVGLQGLVIFAHGSGSSRFSPRNQWVARSLGEAGYATLLFDLLTEGEAQQRANVFDIDLLSGRLVNAIDWAIQEPDLEGASIGLFGASTGAAAALKAAAARPGRVRAVISRGGRPDLAADVLGRINIPTLFIVGGDDEPVLSWNRDAARQLARPAHVEVVPRATHLFEEPGALDEVVRLAVDWCDRYLKGPPSHSVGLK